MRLRFLLPLFLLTLLPASAQAAPGGINGSFSSQGFSGEVQKVGYLPGGDILASGDFGDYGSFSGGEVRSLVRLNPDGSRDSTLSLPGTGFTFDLADPNAPRVYDFEVREDGRIWAVGDFCVFDGAADANKAVLLAANGLRVLSFATDKLSEPDTGDGTGFRDVANTQCDASHNTQDVRLEAVAEMSGGDILVGGQFDSYNGAAYKNLIRLNPDGTVDPSWTTTMSPDFRVSDIDKCPSGKLVVAGDFSQVNGNSNLRKVAVFNADGSLDGGFQDVGTGFDFSVATVECLADGDILAGGVFTKYGAVNRKGILRLNPDGTLDTGFGVDGSGPTSWVTGIALTPTGKIAVSGLFTTFSDGVSTVARNRLAQLNEDGSLDQGFVVGSGFNASSRSLALNEEGSLLFGGDFMTYQGSPQSNLVLLNSAARLGVSISGQGTVSSSPAGISCPGSCTAWFEQGQSLTLSASPASGYLFSGFTGGCVASSSCTLSLLGETAVAAGFSTPGPAPGPGPGPSPDPGPTPSVSVKSLKAKISKKTAYLTSTVTVSGAGKISQVAVSGKKSWCKTSKSASKAGSYQLRCNLGRKGRSYLRKRRLSLSVTTSLAPTSGSAVSVKRSLRISKRR